MDEASIENNSFAREALEKTRTDTEFVNIQPEVRSRDTLGIQEVEADRFHIFHDIAPEVYPYLKDIRDKRPDIKIVVLNDPDRRRVGLIHEGDQSTDTLGYIAVVDHVTIPDGSIGDDYYEVEFGEMYLIDQDNNALSVNSILPPNQDFKKAMAIELRNDLENTSDYTGYTEVGVGFFIEEIKEADDVDTLLHEISHLWQYKLDLFRQEDLTNGFRTAMDDRAEYTKLTEGAVAQSVSDLSLNERVANILRSRLQKRILDQKFATSEALGSRYVGEDALRAYD